MRGWLVSVLILSACGTPREFRGGQATGFLGRLQVGGVYNPKLANCSLTATGVEIPDVETQSWDPRGRLLTSTQSTDAGDYVVTREWEGPCIVRQDEEAPDGWWSTTETACDDTGWPVSSMRTTSEDAAGPEEFTYTNTYDGHDLVQIDDGFGNSTALTWADRRLVRLDYTGADGATGAGVLDYSDDGWLLELDDGEDVFTYVYDIDGRLTRIAWRGVAEEYDYASETAPVPGLRRYIDEAGNTYQTELAYVCE